MESLSRLTEWKTLLKMEHCQSSPTPFLTPTPFKTTTVEGPNSGRLLCPGTQLESEALGPFCDVFFTAEHPIVERAESFPLSFPRAASLFGTWFST